MHVGLSLNLLMDNYIIDNLFYFVTKIFVLSSTNHCKDTNDLIIIGKNTCNFIHVSRESRLFLEANKTIKHICMNKQACY